MFLKAELHLDHNFPHSVSLKDGMKCYSVQKFWHPVGKSLYQFVTC